MINLKKSLTLPHGLKSLNNVEIYYIISNLFELGGLFLGKNYKDKERLFICFDKPGYIKFLFLHTVPLKSRSQNYPMTHLYFGEFDEDFQVIEIYGDCVPCDIFSAESKYIGDGYKISELLKDTDPVAVKPIHLVQGLLRIMSNPHIKTRNQNALSLLTKSNLVPESHKKSFNLFAKLQPEKNSYKSFSGSILFDR
jgi:hypothetical protein